MVCFDILPAYFVMFVVFNLPAFVFSKDMRILGLATNCSSDSIPCGPAPNCCPPGLLCNFIRGIPVCYNPDEGSLSGFDEDPCEDPNFFRCDEVLSIVGSCCPIGTVCRIHGASFTIECVDAFGKTGISIPSTKTGAPIPSATVIPEYVPVYSPSDEWKALINDMGCGSSADLRTTSTINASVSVNYTGPSIRFHTVTSPTGGVFSIIVDGFNTTSIVDTFMRTGDPSVPACYPLQYPPFAVTPPDYASRDSHNISLVYIGPSFDKNSPDEGISVQFGSFAIPNPNSASVSSTNLVWDRKLIFIIAVLIRVLSVQDFLDH